MSKKELHFDNDLFVFETVMRVRHTEIDTGHHLTLESLTALLNEARLRFLYSRGIKEVNSDYQGLIIDELQLSVNRLARFREELLFEIGIEPLYDNGGYIVIKVTRMQTGDTVATARLHFIGYDFQLNKTATLNNSIKEALYPHLFKI
ncbi:MULTISPECIES: thioesterase family protein [unclassified Psychrobacter]|uniref:thioesterase family protein n=1 Tax=unclassified Psychrobacter TaxID=196806 RepID=UPI001865FE9F|nr:thioesterase family protein [Psychrobacter sp. FME61]